MTEQTIRNALACIDPEQWQPKQRGDKILLKSERWTAEITGVVSEGASYTQYDKEAVCKYIAAVSPENIAALLVEMDELRNRIKSNGYDDDIWHNIVKLNLRAMEMDNGGQNKVEE